MNTTLSANFNMLCEMLEFIQGNNKNTFKKIISLLCNTFDAESLNDLKKLNLFNLTVNYYTFNHLFEKYDMFLDAVTIFIASDEQKIEELKTIYEQVSKNGKRKMKENVFNCIVLIILLGFVSVKTINSKSRTELYDFLKDKDNQYKINVEQLYETCLVCEKILQDKRINDSVKISCQKEKINILYIAATQHINDIAISINNTKQEVYNLKSKLYTQILEIIGILIAVFSIIGINLSHVTSITNTNIKLIVLTNLCVMISITIAFFFISLITDLKSTKRYWIIGTFILLVAVFVGCYIYL